MGSGTSLPQEEQTKPLQYINASGRSPAHIPRGSTLESFLRSQAKLREPRLGFKTFLLCAQRQLALRGRVEDLGDIYQIVWSFLKPLCGAALLPPRGRRSICGDRNDGRYGLGRGT